MDFSNYSAKDFVLNESFQKWILDPDEETRTFWNDWLTKHLNKTEVIEEAKTMVRNIKTVIKKDIECDAKEIWSRISKDIDELKETEKHTHT